LNRSAEEAKLEVSLSLNPGTLACGDPDDVEIDHTGISCLEPGVTIVAACDAALLAPARSSAGVTVPDGTVGRVDALGTPPQAATTTTSAR
jgi:hypothetical protein